jgi:hypothetical protein
VLGLVGKKFAVKVDERVQACARRLPAKLRRLPDTRAATRLPKRL